MKMDKEVKNVSKATLLAVAKATELFLAFVAVRTCHAVTLKKKKNIKLEDILGVIHRTEALQFLRPDFPVATVSASAQIVAVPKNIPPPSLPKNAISSFFLPKSSSSLKRSQSENVDEEDNSSY
jgi:hypothetical protein